MGLTEMRFLLASPYRLQYRETARPVYVPPDTASGVVLLGSAQIR